MKPSERIGPYEIVARIGAGGMGEVYRARDMRLGRDVAIKVLPPAFAADPDRLRRFEQEARATATLNHPNILAVYDVGSYEDSPYLVEELLEGESLRERIKGGALPLRKAIDIAGQVARGLAAAHDKGIIHRDLKPENVFVTSDGTVKILDFGLAKLARGDSEADLSTLLTASAPQTVVGTAGYMAPEQVRGLALDHRADIFAFGCLLYEMLSGRPAFRRETNADTITAILSKEPPPLSEPDREIPGALQVIVSQCLEKRPDDRFSTAHDVMLALRALSGAGEASPARSSVARSTGGGRPWLKVAGALVVLAAAVLLSVRLFHRSPPTAAAAATPSIAVLPFTSLSANKDQEYFSDGLSEELMGLLTKVKELHVAGRTSSFAFKGKEVKLGDIGRELHVATVLEGSVRRSGDRLRVSAELVNVANGYQLWAETYDRTMGDVFVVQDDIARAVVAALRVKLLPQERPSAPQHQTKNLEAYRQYLLGRHFFNAMNPEGWHRAVAAFADAVRLDPGYAAAYAALANVELDLAGLSETNAETVEWERKGRSAVETAISLDPTLAGAFSMRGRVRVRAFDWAGAQADQERALALDPGNLDASANFSNLLMFVGQMPQAISEARRATDLDPLSGLAWLLLGRVLYTDGDLQGAGKALTTAVGISPEGVSGHYYLGLVLLREKELNAALAEFGRTVEGYRLQGTAWVEHDLGHAAASERALDELIAKYADTDAYQIAQVYAWRAEKNKALEWLDRAYSQRDVGLTFVKVDPIFAGLHSDPRYESLLRRMNFPLRPSP